MKCMALGRPCKSQCHMSVTQHWATFVSHEAADVWSVSVGQLASRNAASMASVASGVGRSRAGAAGTAGKFGALRRRQQVAPNQ